MLTAHKQTNYRELAESFYDILFTISEPIINQDEIKECINCGHQNQSDIIFCSTCGFKFSRKRDTNSISNTVINESNEIVYTKHNSRIRKEISVHGISLKGKRINNEDAFGIFQNTIFSNDKLQKASTFVVCDGMGGGEQGEYASDVAVTKLCKYSDSNLVEGIKSANKIIYNHAKKQSIDIGTTVVACVIKENSVTVVWAGDSRFYLFRDKKIEYVTEDHSEVAELLNQGKITIDEAKYYPRKNIITKSLGESEIFEPSVKELSIEYGDRILLCSDGLCGVIEDEMLIEIIYNSNSPMEACHSLTDFAVICNSTDNITVITAFI